MRILGACKKTKEESYDLSFSISKITELFLDYASMPLPGIVGRGEFTSYYSL